MIRSKATLRWRVSGSPDARRVRFVAAFSPDGGDEWTPLGVNLRDRSLTVSPDDLPRTRNGLIRLIASDGIRSDYADVRVTVAGRGPGPDARG